MLVHEYVQMRTHMPIPIVYIHVCIQIYTRVGTMASDAIVANERQNSPPPACPSIRL